MNTSVFIIQNLDDLFMNIKDLESLLTTFSNLLEGC